MISEDMSNIQDSKLSQELKQKKEEIRRKIQELRMYSEDLNSQKEMIQSQRLELRAKEEGIEARSKVLQAKEEELRNLEDSLMAKERENNRKLKLIKEESARLDEVKKSLEMRSKKVQQNSDQDENSFSPDINDEDDQISEETIEGDTRQPKGFLADKVHNTRVIFSKNDGENKLKAAGVVLLTLIAITAAGFITTNVLMSVVVGTGNEVIVPDLHDVHFDVARKTSRDIDLFVQQVDHQHHDEIAQNRIISQTPEPGRRTKANRTIEVIVSLGPELIRVPHLDNITEREARLRLENVGLEMGQVLHRYSDRVDRDRIINSHPAADTYVHRGSEVSVYVSLGDLPDASDRHQRYRGVLDEID